MHRNIFHYSLLFLILYFVIGILEKIVVILFSFFSRVFVFVNLKQKFLLVILTKSIEKLNTSSIIDKKETNIMYRLTYEKHASTIQNFFASFCYIKQRELIIVINLRSNIYICIPFPFGLLINR